jgi:hypothetical protein
MNRIDRLEAKTASRRARRKIAAVYGCSVECSFLNLRGSEQPDAIDSMAEAGCDLADREFELTQDPYCLPHEGRSDQGGLVVIALCDDDEGHNVLYCAVQLVGALTSSPPRIESVDLLDAAFPTHAGPWQRVSDDTRQALTVLFELEGEDVAISSLSSALECWVPDSDFSDRL